MPPFCVPCVPSLIIITSIDFNFIRGSGSGGGGNSGGDGGGGNSGDGGGGGGR